jgi:multidrug efflux pump subunit AcrA (membrane-fusion protein)
MAGVVSSDQVGVASGAVRVITPEVDPQTRVGLARIALSAPGGFRPGMFANGKVNVGALPALTVPTGAILYRDNKPGLFVVDAQNIAHYRQVTTGARTGEAMEITSGVNAGERVATDGAGFLADGDHVRVAASTQPGAR